MKLIEIAILTNIKGLGSINLNKVLNYCKLNNITSLHELQNACLRGVVNNKLVDSIMSYLDCDLSYLYKNMENILSGYSQDNIHCVSINDEKYPDILKESTNPPVILYCKGNIDLLNSKCIAVIGTRKNSPIGERIATKTVEFLVQKDFTIVSGLAKGIDTIAHDTALSNHGKTIAILPLIDNIYPEENKELVDRILDSNGLLISEEKPKKKFFSGQLVKRDRIQSGISKAVFIIETSAEGGSMHATNDAIKLKRPVFTPDVYQLDETYQNQKQVEGIKYLIDTDKSISYTSKNYDEVISQLNLSLHKGRLF